MAKVTKPAKNAEETNPPKKSRGGDRRSKAAKKAVSKRNSRKGENITVVETTISTNEIRIPYKSFRIVGKDIVFTI